MQQTGVEHDADSGVAPEPAGGDPGEDPPSPAAPDGGIRTASVSGAGDPASPRRVSPRGPAGTGAVAHSGSGGPTSSEAPLSTRQVVRSPPHGDAGQSGAP